MHSSHPKVLIVDDDPMHLEIYGLLMKQAGYEALPLLVRFTGTEIPKSQSIGLALLDYRLNSARTSPEYAQEIRAVYPGIPILVLSDLWALPADIAPFVTGFVRKGEPAKLLEAVAEYLHAKSEKNTSSAQASRENR
jgi:DNA-binding NtrC family response regulator